MKTTTWLVMTNSVETKIYGFDEDRTAGKVNTVLIEHLRNDNGRLKNIDLNADDHGPLMPRSDAHENEHIHFAKALATFLDEAGKKSRYQAIILCAEPHFYGLLEQAMTPFVQRLVKKHIAKDYIPFSSSKLNEVIAQIIHGTV